MAGRAVDSPAVGAILSRRSTRADFTGEPIVRESLEAIMACGLAAPSSKNAQPWRLHVVTDRALIADLAHAVRTSPDIDDYVPHDPRTGRPIPRYVSTVRESADVLEQVPAAIFVENLGAFSGGRATLAAAPHDALVGSLVGYTLEIIGIGAAIQNMWVAAHSLGVGVAFMGDVLIAEPAIRSRLGLTGDLIGVLAMGYSDAAAALLARPRPDDDARVVWH